MAKITYVTHDDQRFEVDAANGSTVMENAIKNSVPGIEAECGGACACATCHVYIDAKWSAQLPERQDDELELLEDTECFDADTSRLSCQIIVSDELDGMRVKIAPEE